MLEVLIIAGPTVSAVIWGFFIGSISLSIARYVDNQVSDRLVEWWGSRDAFVIIPYLLSVVAAVACLLCILVIFTSLLPLTSIFAAPLALSVEIMRVRYWRKTTSSITEQSALFELLHRLRMRQRPTIFDIYFWGVWAAMVPIIGLIIYALIRK